MMIVVSGSVQPRPIRRVEGIVIRAEILLRTLRVANVAERSCAPPRTYLERERLEHDDDNLWNDAIRRDLGGLSVVGKRDLSR